MKNGKGEGVVTMGTRAKKPHFNVIMFIIIIIIIIPDHYPTIGYNDNG